MQILFQYTFDYPIWRIIPSSTEKSYWGIEFRNASTKDVEYFSINQDLQLKKIDTKLNWWSGIECVMGETIVFHEYIQQDLPIHKGVFVFNAESNQLLWSNEFVAFVSANNSQINVKTIIGSSEQKLALNAANGTEESLLDQNEFISNQNVVIGQDQNYFEEISFLIQKYTHLMPVIICEYLETDFAIIISYYIKQDIELENYILVTNLKGDEIMHLCIAKGLKGVATGTFNVSNSLLSFVKDRNELFITTLIKSDLF